MRQPQRSRYFVAGIILASLGALLAVGPIPFSVAQQPATDLSAYYGFGPLEIYKLQQRSGNLIAADLTGDGRNDLVLIDNSNSRLDLLVQRDPKAAREGAEPSANKRINTIDSDKRFEHRKIAVDREVAALAVGDFNSDGLKDLAWFGKPDQLTIAWQQKQGDWSNRRKIRLADVEATQWDLTAGDLNNDGKDDLVVLGKHDTYIVYQDANKELAAPVRLMNTTEQLGLANVVDLDGDGRNDLCYLASDESERPLCVRLQLPDGKLGPELRCELSKYRGVTFANLDGRPGIEVLAIEAQTGRVKAHRLERPEIQPGEAAGQLVQFGFGQQGTGKSRDLALGDLDGDGLTDIVVTDPEGAQLIAFRQYPQTGLDLGTPFPGLVGGEQVRIGDVDGDKQAEVFTLSNREKTIGVSRLEAGRLTFPQPIPLDREPAAIDLADLNSDGRPDLVLIGKDRSGSSPKYSLKGLRKAPTGEWQTHKFGEQEAISLSLKTDPERLLALDANRDGQTDFLVFAGSDKPPQLLLTNSAGVPVELPASEVGAGLGTISPGALTLGRLNEPVILAARNNFARSLALSPKNQWQVIDQYNADEAAAKISGTATLDLDGEPGNEIVLIDQGVKKLRILRREGNLYRPWREVDIGAFPYRAAFVADLNGDQRDDLLIFGSGKFGVLYAGRTDPRLKTVATYESKEERIHFLDLVAGDLNSDGQLDVAVIDTQSQFIDILNYAAAVGLRHALQFKVFEAKSLANEDRTGIEPRESVIADVTGDGRADLILLSHDRILLYPQDAGSDSSTASATKK